MVIHDGTLTRVVTRQLAIQFVRHLGDTAGCSVGTIADWGEVLLFVVTMLRLATTTAMPVTSVERAWDWWLFGDIFAGGTGERRVVSVVEALCRRWHILSCSATTRLLQKNGRGRGWCHSRRPGALTLIRPSPIFPTKQWEVLYTWPWQQEWPKESLLQTSWRLMSNCVICSTQLWWYRRAIELLHSIHTFCPSVVILMHR